jgi:hypothetical protein
MFACANYANATFQNVKDYMAENIRRNFVGAIQII